MNFLDFDAFMEVYLESYLKVKEIYKGYVDRVFYSADFDMDQMIEYYEFITLYRYIEGN